MNAALIGLIAGLWVALYAVVRRWSTTASAIPPAQTQSAPNPSSFNVHRSLFIIRLAPFLTELIAAFGLLALATVGFFWQILLTPNTWMPAGGGDLAPFLYPNYRFAAEQLRQGVIPLWNPHLYGGSPFAADIQSGLFYPINLLVFFLAPSLSYKSLEFLAIFHFWLAGSSMYLCLRLLIPHENGDDVPYVLGGRIAPLAAFAGAIAFQFSDLFIVHFGNLNMIAVAAWLPLIFLLFHHSLSRSSLGLAAAAGAVLAIATLAGHIQITLFILLTLGLYTLWRLAITRHVSRFTSPLLALFITLLVTIALATLLLLPAYQLGQYTPRAELPYEEAAQYSLHPAQLVGLLIPNYFGRDPALHWGPWERVETGYIGLMTLLLALIGAFIYKGRLKSFFIILAGVALLLALGGHTLLHGWLYVVMPGFDQLRAPARFILLLDFSLAVLAALGLNQLLQPLDDRAQGSLSRLLKPLTWGLGGLIIVAAPLSYVALLITQDRNPVIFNRAAGAVTGVALLALFTIASLVVLHLISSQWLRAKRAGLVVIGIIMLDLFTLGSNVDVGQTDPVAGFDHPEALAFLQSDPGLYRIEVTTDIWHLWQPNTALATGLDDVWGLYNPLTLADTTLYWSGAPPRSSGRYNFLGVKYIIASKAGAPADGDIVPVFDSDPQINIYLNQAALPRALFVGRAVVVPDHDAAWQAIRADEFDPATTVILEGGQPLDTEPASTVSILSYDLQTISIEVETDQPGYLVVPDAYYPGWEATMDGQPTPIQRANYAFRAVYVPAGKHVVQFVFDPLIWKVGVSLSGVTFLILVGWAGWRLKGAFVRA
jgi:hypothetical protein